MIIAAIRPAGPCGILVFSWFRTKNVDWELAIGTVSFDMPLARILALTAIDDCGLKSPSTSEIAGVKAKESQMNRSLSSAAPRSSSIVSRTNSTDEACTYIRSSRTQPAASKKVGSIADSESK